MKIFVITLFLFFSTFAACAIYAGNNNISVSYPAPSGSYNKLILQAPSPLAAPPDCTQQSSPGVYVNVGILYMDPTTHALQMCTNDGTHATVPYPETCFNRFCSWHDGTPNPSSASPGVGGNIYCTANPLNGCPPGYAWAATLNSPIQDIFTTSSSGATYYHLESTVCCSTGSTVNPSFNP